MTTVIPTPDFTCPNCGHTEMECRHQRVSMPYGSKPYAQMIYFNTVLQCCRKCGNTFTGPLYEDDQEAAIKEHRMKHDRYHVRFQAGNSFSGPYTEVVKAVNDVMLDILQRWHNPIIITSPCMSMVIGADKDAVDKFQFPPQK